MKYTPTAAEAARGELRVRTLSAAAREGYNSTDPLKVYEILADKTYWLVKHPGGWTECRTLADLDAELASWRVDDDDSDGE